MPILMLCATINGYDGSLLNGLQTIEEWRSCTFATANTWKNRTDLLFSDFGHPSGSTLGLLTAIVNVGGFSALFFCESGQSPWLLCSTHHP
jgi:hypothetical protein